MSFQDLLGKVGTRNINNWRYSSGNKAVSLWTGEHHFNNQWKHLLIGSFKIKPSTEHWQNQKVNVLALQPDSFSLNSFISPSKCWIFHSISPLCGFPPPPLAIGSTSSCIFCATLLILLICALKIPHLTSLSQYHQSVLLDLKHLKPTNSWLWQD